MLCTTAVVELGRGGGYTHRTCNRGGGRPVRGACAARPSPGLARLAGLCAAVPAPSALGSTALGARRLVHRPYDAGTRSVLSPLPPAVNLDPTSGGDDDGDVERQRRGQGQRARPAGGAGAFYKSPQRPLDLVVAQNVNPKSVHPFMLRSPRHAGCGRRTSSSRCSHPQASPPAPRDPKKLPQTVSCTTPTHVGQTMKIEFRDTPRTPCSRGAAAACKLPVPSSRPQPRPLRRHHASPPQPARPVQWGAT
jgi:hypothetical protein